MGEGNQVNQSVQDSFNGMTPEEIKQLFDQLLTAIDTNETASTSDKEDIKAEVEEIQTKVTDVVKAKGNMEERFLARRFRNIACMSPDILDVVVATIGNPLAGLGVAVKKIADKAKEDTKQTIWKWEVRRSISTVRS